MKETLKNIQLHIPQEIHQQLLAYIAACDIEFSCLIDATYNEKLNVILLGKIYLLEQEATAETVELDDDALDTFDFQLIKNAPKGESVQLPRCWMHSHADHGVFFSATDQKTIESRHNNSFNVALVMNKAQQMRADIHIAIAGLGIDDHYVIENAPTFILYDDTKYLAKAKKEIADKVKTKTYKPYTGIKKFKNSYPEYYDLPENLQGALDFIESFQLQERWDFTLKEFVYINPLSGNVYLDITGQVSQALVAQEGENPYE